MFNVCVCVCQEMKEGISETAESVLQQGKKGAEQLYEAACDGRLGREGAEGGESGRGEREAGMISSTRSSHVHGTRRKEPRRSLSLCAQSFTSLPSLS